MKIRSLRTVAILFAVSVITTSHSFAANFVERHFNRDRSSSEGDIEVIHCRFTPRQIAEFIHDGQIALTQISGNLNNLFNMEGTLFRNQVNPFTPGTGVLQYLDAINGFGPGSNGQAAEEIINILRVLIKDQNLVAQIINEQAVYIGLGESYAVAINTNASLTEQFALAGAWVASSERLGDLYLKAGVTSFVINPVTGQKDNIKGLLGNLAIIQSQIAQAFAAVLDGPNSVGAIPGNLNSQMAAAAALSIQINLLLAEINELIVLDLACPGKRGEHDRDNRL